MKKINYLGFRILVILATLTIGAMLVAGWVKVGLNSVRWYDTTEQIAYIIGSLMILFWTIGQIKLLLNVVHQVTEYFRTKRLHESKAWQDMILANGGQIRKEGNFYSFLDEI